MTEALPIHVAVTIDVRKVPWSQRHAKILTTFEALAPGSAMELVVDHEPLPLRELFIATREGLFQWDDLENGPDLWRVRITRRGGSDCCGGCACR
ncbi:MAG TPA: DUF2249 domain-containing protein [Burkholderiaceae bacterium]|nr:DUF2249 domain-containing protein [Burkholderiaceae bacterium]